MLQRALNRVACRGNFRSLLERRSFDMACTVVAFSAFAEFESAFEIVDQPLCISVRGAGVGSCV